VSGSIYIQTAGGRQFQVLRAVAPSCSCQRKTEKSCSQIETDPQDKLITSFLETISYCCVCSATRAARCKEPPSSAQSMIEMNYRFMILLQGHGTFIQWLEILLTYIDTQHFLLWSPYVIGQTIICLPC